HDLCAANALSHVLVRGADAHLRYFLPVAKSGCRRSERIVGLELDHRPNDQSQCAGSSLGESELIEQSLRIPLARLVLRVEVIPERLDVVVESTRDVGDV